MADVEEELPLQEIESLCMRCGENGTTRLLLTRIPHFREIVLMAFECPHCNERNNEVQFAGQLQSQGSCHTLTVPKGDAKVLSRQVVKSDSATIKIPELEFEVPPEAQRGTLSTVEGVLLRAAEEIGALQEERRKTEPSQAEALDRFLVKLRSCAMGESSFTFIISDPAGNSFVENPHAPGLDPLLSVRFYDRSPAEQAALGFLVDPSLGGDKENSSRPEEKHSEETRKYVPAGTQKVPHGTIGAQLAYKAILQGNSEDVASSLLKYSAPEEVMTFPSTCGACAARCETRMYATNIPYFKEVIVMASTCDTCGYRNSELKPGGSIPIKGRKISVRVLSRKDLSRDVIKSDTSSVTIPELELELASGTLGGLVTTVEGLLQQISERLKGMNQFCLGDSAMATDKHKWREFEEKMKKLLNMEAPWTLILDDPLANSFIAPITDTIQDDVQLHSDEYERTWQENEDLGLNDMNTSSADAAYEKEGL
ncbi:hypothetical protein GOP47_0001576 [Adiantum capillus-veneris]|uniref:Zinc finger ZPR1-type domain-containing protein n=1 Tax=Adiantum capillus-veneris TaxID=13818 RepID=A0A9D4ZN71_ADICA|nr:hypothetical protein GOP47_0001576 [Adiantum capillus-veneris]